MLRYEQKQKKEKGKKEKEKAFEPQSAQRKSIAN